MKTLKLILIFLFCSIQVYSQPYGWFVQNSGTSNNLNGVAFINNNTGIAIGQSGTVRITTNGGTNWGGVTSPTTAHLFGVTFINSSTGWIVGDIGVIMRTTNAGFNWVLQTSGTGIQLRSVSFVNVNTGYVVGWYGVFLRTTNGGLNWTTISTGVSSNLLCVYFIDANTGFACGQFGKLLRTTNSGLNWSEIASGTTNQLESVHFLNASTGVVVGENGTARRTTNGGVNWTTQSLGTGNWIYAMSTKQNLFHTIVGDYGTVRKTSNGGLNWYSQNSNTGNLLTAVSFVDTNTGWAVGINGTIIKTTTGGWLLPGTASLIAPANGATCVSLNTYFDWSDVFPPVSNYRLQIATNSGFTNIVYDLSGINVSDYTMPPGILSYNTMYYWRVRATNQVGESPNWSSVRSFTSTTIVPATPGLILPPNNTVTNLTPFLCWDSITTAETYRCVVATDSNFVNIVLDSNGIVNRAIYVPPGRLVNNTRYYWRVRGQNSCNNGSYSVRWSFITNNPTSVTGKGKEIPAEYALYNNYPNPFNPVTNIRFDLPERNFVQLDVYDINGALIETLAKEEFEAGRYEVRWDAGKYASGLYFAVITAGNFRDSKKMLLIK